MKSFMIATLLLFSQLSVAASPVFGADSLPELSGQVAIGRIPFFKSSIGVSWYAPVGFSSQFDCGGEGTQRTCVVRIFNRLTVDELAKIQAAEQEEKLITRGFSDVESWVVSGITESFSGLPADVQSQQRLMRTLRMDERNSYDQATFRTGSHRAKELQDLFKSQGLGSFDVSFRLNAQKTLSFVGLLDGACILKNLNEKSQNHLSRWEVESLVGRILQQCDLRAMGLSQKEAMRLARYDLINRFFKPDWYDYEVDQEALKNLRSPHVVEQVVDAPVTLLCETHLALREGAQPTFKCQEGK